MIFFLFFLGMFLAIALAGFISGSETAVTSASHAYLYHLAKKGNGNAKKVITLQENLSSTISTILILNQLVLYLIPICSTLFAVKHFTSAEAAALQVIIAVLIIVYAEIFPKMLVIKFTIPFALFIGPVLFRVVTILRPVTAILEKCARSTLKVMGIDVDKQDLQEQADEELRGAIEMHPSVGDEEETQKKSMLKSILDLEEISVSHTMIHRKNLKTINASLPIEKIAEELTNCHFSRVPLWKDNPENIIGVLKTKTFFHALQLQNGNLEKIRINQLMSAPWFIPDTKHLLDQLQDFRKKGEHFALVVDEYGDLQGCITLEDILEEIVGEIVDEYDIMTDGVKLQADGSVIAEGVTPIRDLNREFDWNLPEEEAATIAGYVMHEVRKIPDIGQTYVLSGFKIEILKRQRNQIGLVKITPPTL
ncbi:MAG: CNNM domain-containing protein [Holosporaceae bacterium]|jgi:Mg2+/Co2+ transporter CorB|nr:CNNM domain-containing protein [Holosporaceae bacterium]